MSHRTILSEETTKSVSDASTAFFFSRPCVVKSIPFGIITQIVQDAISTKQRARERTSLVSASITIHLGAAKGFVQDSIG
jgi:hypothetical protein